MKGPSNALLLLIAVLLMASQAYPCTWTDGYFYQVSALRGNVVGAKIGPLQYVRWLRHSFTRKNAQITLYQYRRPVKQRDEMPLVRTTKTDINGYFDFGEVAPGHYTLIVDDNELGTSDWFDVEVKQQAKQTVAVTIDVSPPFPDCKGGHEFIVQYSGFRGLGWAHLVSSAVIASLGLALWYLWIRRRRMRHMASTTD
jgi:hypothetical protein